MVNNPGAGIFFTFYLVSKLVFDGQWYFVPFYFPVLILHRT